MLADAGGHLGFQVNFGVLGWSDRWGSQLLVQIRSEWESKTTWVYGKNFPSKSLSGIPANTHSQHRDLQQAGLPGGTGLRVCWSRRNWSTWAQGHAGLALSLLKTFCEQCSLVTSVLLFLDAWNILDFKACCFLLTSLKRIFWGKKDLTGEFSVFYLFVQLGDHFISMSMLSKNTQASLNVQIVKVLGPHKWH